MEEAPKNENQEETPTEYQELDDAFDYLRNGGEAKGILNAYLALRKGVRHGLDVSRYRSEFPDLAKAARAGELKDVLWELEDAVKELEQGKAGDITSKDFTAVDALMEAAESGVDPPVA
jgi:hypothetical protein